MDDDNYSHDFDRPSQVYTHDEVTPPLNISTFKSHLAEGLHSTSPPLIPSKPLLTHEPNANDLVIK